MTFNERLRLLGFDSYAQYLKSDVWAKFREKWKRTVSKSHKRCKVCGSKKYQLHHRTYDNLGCERISDVVALCSIHHDQVHQILGELNLPVKKTKDAIKKAKERMRPMHNAEKHAALKAKAARSLEEWRAKHRR